MNKSVSFILAAIVGLSAAAPAADLLSIRMVPDEINLWGANSAQRILLLGKFSDGLERDLTAESRIAVSNPSVARIDHGVRVIALSDGRTEVTAAFQSFRTQSKLKIENSQMPRPFQFARDIGEVLTRRGCNNNTCHGSVIGRAGFKLSVDALYPEEDYNWILKGGIYSVFSVEPKAPSPARINLDEPAKSPLLLKPTMAIPHGGGRLFRPEDADYATLLTWIQKGAPYAEQVGGRMKGLEVYPKEAILDLVGSHQILVTAQLSNGRTEDVTSQVRYALSNNEVATVTEGGLVKPKATGETAVIIHAAGLAPVTAWVGVVAQPVANYPPVARRNFIDDYTFAKLRTLSVIPSGLSSDAEFLRRVCLDVTGTLPPPRRVREFLASKDPNKRDKLIDALLDSPEYVEYWTFRFADLFRVALWAQNAITKASETYWEWIRDSIASNKPYDQIARERISAQGYEGPVMHYQSVDEFKSPQDNMAEEVRLFLGRRLDCAQCHNHPYEPWSQNQFWGMAGFFGRVTRLGDQSDFVLIDYPSGHGELGKGLRMVHPRTKQDVDPKFLDGASVPTRQASDPRMSLAEWMTSPRNPYFAEAAVNRMWSHFFGRGFVNPVDDFRITNPPTHSALLRAFAMDFQKHGYDLKHLFRVILQSATYQASHAPNESNKADTSNYSRAYSRPLDAEVLWDAINQFAGANEGFEHWGGGRASRRTRAIDLVTPDLFPAHFLEVYGRPNRLMVPERKMDANLGQALHILAGSAYTSKLSEPGARVDRALKSGAADRQIIEDFYLAALSRFPTAQEQSEIEQWMLGRESRREALEDLAWSLIASREFAYNH
ncbi:MAG: DUF1553 domain-containing protein [Acidobacteria bacterium]|nr:DUF1553 domain-containing protein [Acidobacteriota bacterium]